MALLRCDVSLAGRQVMSSKKIMDHAEALKMMATEKYLLGELTEGERDSFEDHYFSCAACAADIKCASIVANDVREMAVSPQVHPAVMTKQERHGSWLAWLRPWTVPALALILLAVVLYQNSLVIPGLRQNARIAPQALATFSLVTAGTRGVAGVSITTEKGKPFGLYFDIPSGKEFSSYTCEVQDKSGKRKLAVQVGAQQARDSVQLLIPDGTLDSGEYQLLVRGHSESQTPGEEILRLPFEVQVK